MAKKDTRNVNVTINNNSDDSDIVVSIGGIFKKLKKYFLPWILSAAIIGVLVGGFACFRTLRDKPPLTALISFNFDGIENGKDPSGRNFDVNIVKNSQVLAAALIAEDIDIEKAAVVQDSITFEGIMPADAIDRITTYRDIYENAASGNLAAAQAMLDVTYHPTQFKVYFDYDAAGLKKDEGVQLFNAILEGFNDYFYQQYGYNRTLGTAVAAIDYSSYDYNEAVDLFRSTLTTLNRYVRQLANSDDNQFRSSQTGYTFNDLSQTINTISSIDLDKISSYITVNHITKDKETSVAYFQFRIDALNREKESLTQRLADVNETIAGYQKDQILIMATADGNGTEVNTNSGEYDRLIERKDSISSDLADTNQNIKYYTQCLEQFQGTVLCTPEMQQRVEESFVAINEKLKQIIDATQITADEYFEVVEFANAYNILVPPVNSSTDILSSIIHNSILPLLILEALAFVVYAVIALVAAIKAENKKQTAKALCCGGDDDDDDDNNDDDSDETDEENASEDDSEDDSEEKKEKKTAASNKNKQKKK